MAIQQKDAGIKMKHIWKLYNNLSKRKKTSIYGSFMLIGAISTLMSVIGISLSDLTKDIWLSLLIVVAAFVLIAFIVYIAIEYIFRESMSLVVRNTDVSISCGNIFECDAWRVIGCDTCFNTRVDDIVISRKSLHGQLIIDHGNVVEIKSAIEREAQKLKLNVDSNGQYNFPLGTIIRYDSSVDKHTYLMLAMTELNEKYESHTNMAKFETMLMKMWAEISRVYASHDVVLPVLGTGISRFDDGPKDKGSLLRCMLCTLNSSGVTFNSKVKVVIFGNADDIQLYEYRDMFNSLNV